MPPTFYKRAGGKTYSFITYIFAWATNNKTDFNLRRRTYQPQPILNTEIAATRDEGATTTTAGSSVEESK